MKKYWLRFKAWIYSILVVLGLVSVPFVLAQPVGFSYTPATQYTTGEAMPLSDIQFTRLYCNDVLVADEPGADGNFNVDLSPGSYTCYATHVAGDQESDPSNVVAREVRFGPPNAPVLE